MNQKHNAHVYRPVFQAESKFQGFGRARHHLQGAGALCHQEPHVHQQEKIISMIFCYIHMAHVFRSVFQEEFEFCGFRNVGSHPEGPGVH